MAAKGMKLPSQSSPKAEPSAPPAPAVAGATSEHFESIFVFPRNSKQLLRSRVWSERIKFILQAYIWPPLFWVLRASFGLSLLLSIVLILMAIIILLVIASRRDGDGPPDINIGGTTRFF